MPKDIQVKLLRVLQQGELRPVGSTQAIQVDIRVIAATNRSLAELRSGLMREDLYFRIATIVLEVPALRNRQEDVLVLGQHFASRLSRRYGRQISLSRSAFELLLPYQFPGNVRELENLLESVAAVSVENPQVITERDLRPLLGAGAPRIAGAGGEEPLSLEEMERVAVRRALRSASGNRSKAAALLGISRDTLYRKMRQYEV
jgi:transcriptional regulator with PAS, ATPase and Fis domain